ncbi:MAG TPA: HAD family hydrolase [Anaerolineae bacterium]|nr:HAD family hydrolase [Anaerolineae bacterium]
MDRIAALFDLDRTLLDTSSGQLYARYLYRTGQMSRREMTRVVWWTVLSRLGILDMQALIARLLLVAAGSDQAETQRTSDLWFVEDVLPHVAERGLRRVAEHREQGHVVAIVSASTQYVVAPMAAHLGVPGQYVCTHVRSAGGRLTGELEPPACFGQGKVVWAERFAAEHGVDLDRSYFYTDSISDLPLLERVGQPVAVNPDPRLRRLAQRRGWPIEMFY